MTDEEKSKFRGAGRIAFLARKEEIVKMIEEGYPLLRIYQKHEGKLNISYGQFARYVSKFIRGKSNVENKGKKPGIRTDPVTEKEPIKRSGGGFEVDTDTGPSRRKNTI